MAMITRVVFRCSAMRPSTAKPPSWRRCRPCSPLCCQPGGWLGREGLRNELLGQVAGENEVDSSAWDESLPDDQDLPVRLDEHDRCLTASGQVRREGSAGAEGRVEASAGIQPGDRECRAAACRTQPGGDDLPVGLDSERLNGIGGDRVFCAEVKGRGGKARVCRSRGQVPDHLGVDVMAAEPCAPPIWRDTCRQPGTPKRYPCWTRS